METTNPKTIRWVLESYGWWPEEIVAAGISRQFVQKILTESVSTNDMYIRRMADAINCPLETLLLCEPPTETPLRDFGSNTGSIAVLSRATLKGVGRARYMQSVGQQLMTECGVEVEPDIPSHTIRDDPEEVAESMRDVLTLSMAGAYPNNMTGQDLCASLRDRIESRNIFVTKCCIDWDQVCGFVI